MMRSSVDFPLARRTQDGEKIPPASMFWCAAVLGCLMDDNQIVEGVSFRPCPHFSQSDAAGFNARPAGCLRLNHSSSLLQPKSARALELTLFGQLLLRTRLMALPKWFWLTVQPTVFCRDKETSPHTTTLTGRSRRGHQEAASALLELRSSAVNLLTPTGPGAPGNNSLRSVVQVATPAPKKSLSSVQIGELRASAVANTGQISSSEFSSRIPASTGTPRLLRINGRCWHKYT